jgi:cytosine/adenosine deaminase-related metal-dependent hydrolase
VIVGPCRVVTGGPAPAVIEHAGVRVVGAHIAQVGPLAPLLAAYPGEEVWDAGGRVLLPGLADAHAHLARHLARGLGLATQAEWERYDRALAPEDVHWAAMAALAEGARHGVTTVCDAHRSAGCLDLSLSELTSAAQRTGVRLMTCYAAAEEDARAERAAALRESLSLAADLRRRRSGRLRALVGVRADTLDGLLSLLDETLEGSGAELPVHVELGARSRFGQQWKGMPRSEAACIWAHVERAPLALLSEARERGDTLAWARSGGWEGADDPDLAWGSNDGLHAPPPPPEPGARGPAWKGAETYYQRLYGSGARWAERYFGDGLGVIEAGSHADLVIADYHPATEFDRSTLAAHLATGLARAPVVGVMVAGDVVMDGGALVTVDEDEVAARARECAKRVWKKLG